MRHSAKIVDCLIFGLNWISLGVVLTQNRYARDLEFVTLFVAVRLDPGTSQLDGGSSRKPSRI
jgi:hypothetical protein